MQSPHLIHLICPGTGGILALVGNTSSLSPHSPLVLHSLIGLPGSYCVKY